MKKGRKATISEGSGLEEGASRALMRQKVPSVERDASFPFSPPFRAKRCINGTADFSGTKFATFQKIASLCKDLIWTPAIFTTRGSERLRCFCAIFTSERLRCFFLKSRPPF